MSGLERSGRERRLSAGASGASCASASSAASLATPDGNAAVRRRTTSKKKNKKASTNAKGAGRKPGGKNGARWRVSPHADAEEEEEAATSSSAPRAAAVSMEDDGEDGENGDDGGDGEEEEAPDSQTTAEEVLALREKIATLKHDQATAVTTATQAAVATVLEANRVAREAASPAKITGAAAKKRHSRGGATSSSNSDTSDTSDSDCSSDDSSGDSDSSGTRRHKKKRKSGSKKKRRSNGSHGHAKWKGRGKLTTRKIEDKFHAQVMTAAGISTTKSAEMRKLATLAWCGARLIEKEKKKKKSGTPPDYEHTAVFLVQSLGQYMDALDEFRTSTAETPAKIRALESKLAAFAEKNGRRLGEQTLRWLPVPGAGQSAAVPSNGGGRGSGMRQAAAPTAQQLLMATLTQQLASQQAAANMQAAATPQTNLQPAPYQPQQMQGASAQSHQAWSQQAAAQQMPTGNQQRPPQRAAYGQCFNCLQFGHRANDCPRDRVGQPAAQEQAKVKQVSAERHTQHQLQRAKRANEFEPGEERLPKRPHLHPGGQILNTVPESMKHALKVAPLALKVAQRSPDQGTAEAAGRASQAAEIIGQQSCAHTKPFESVSDLSRSSKRNENSSTQAETKCRCGECGECLHGIDVMRKEAKEHKGIPGQEGKLQAETLAQIVREQQEKLGAISHESNANNEHPQSWTQRIENSKASGDGWELSVGAESEEEEEGPSISESLTRTKSDPPEAQQRLRDYMRTLTHAGRKAFDKYDSSRRGCRFCKRRGHSRATCMCVPPRTAAEIGERQEQTELQRRKEAFVMRLIDTPSPNWQVQFESIGTAKGMRLQVTREAVELGRQMNKDNPWMDSTKRRDMLRKQLGIWWAIGADKVVLGWIGFGVRLRFEVEPPRTAFGNHRSYEIEKEHIEEEHLKHVLDGSFRVADGKEVHACNPLQVEVNAKGKRRQCLDMRYTNSFLADYAFTQETLQKHVAQIIRQNDWLITTDVEKAYYQVPLHKDCQRYCAWRHDGKWIIPTILVFGLSVAPFIFTKIMRVVLRFMRGLNIRGTNCIDDNLWAAAMALMPEVKEVVNLLFSSLGWVFNAKCEWDSTTEVVYNGMWIDSGRFEIRATEEKIEMARKLAWTLWFAARDGLQVKLHDLQRLAGRLQSMRLALEGVAPWTRGLYGVIARTMAAHDQFPPRGCVVWLDQMALEDVNFWAYRLGKQNGLPIRDEGEEVHLTVHTDASDVGWGAHLDGPVQKNLQGTLATEVLGQSSTARELMAVIQACSAAALDLRGHRVQLMMDSYPAFRNLINGGGGVEELNALVREWWVWCRVNRVTPVYKWIRREENQVADALSKVAAESHTLNAAAEGKIRAWLVESGEPGMDADQWKRTVIQVPRFDRVGVRLEEMRRSRRPGCIVVPRWPSQPWYARLREVSRTRLTIGDCSRAIVKTPGEEPFTHRWELVAHLVIPEHRPAKSDRKTSSTGAKVAARD